MGSAERAGNAALEEIAMAMRVRADRLPFETGIDTTEIYSTSQLLSQIIGFGVQPNKAIVGRNAFAHEAGIHQHGVINRCEFLYEYRARAGMVAQHDSLLGTPFRAGVLLRYQTRHSLDHSVLMYAGFVRERVASDDSFVWLHAKTNNL